MHLPWSRAARLEKLRGEPVPAGWVEWLEQNVRYFALLTPEEREVLFAQTRLFIEEKDWEGCAGLALTEEMQVTIAAQACILTLNLAHIRYADVQTVLVYPATVQVKRQARNADMTITESKDPILGLSASHHNPVMVAWQAVVSGGREPADGDNVVFHEFAHKLDETDGRIDGVPLLETEAQIEPYAEAMSAAYQDLVRQSEHGHVSVLNSYGATNEAEFFAVCTEAFFEKSEALERHYPKVYAALKEFYRQDPAARWRAFRGTEQEMETAP